MLNYRQSAYVYRDQHLISLCAQWTVYDAFIQLWFVQRFFLALRYKAEAHHVVSNIKALTTENLHVNPYLPDTYRQFILVYVQAFQVLESASQLTIANDY